MGHRRSALALLAAVALVMSVAAVASAAAPSSDTLVTVASPTTPFSQNKQNEPAVAIDPAHPWLAVAGANEEIDMESCAAAAPNTCPFTPGVGVSGVYFSTNGGGTWTQPTYQGWTARDCLGPAACVPHVGPIGTLPHYLESGLVSDGDPAVAFGPRQGADGTFSWNNGSRLYYANLTSNFDSSGTFKGFEAIAVSRTDNVAAAAAGDAAAWSAPSVISKQSSTTFSDKEQVYADSAAISPFFGRVYVCWASFRSQELGRALPTPLTVGTSADGGSTWTVKQVGPATNNGINGQPDGCTVRTDSQGNAYVFGVGKRNGATLELMYKSPDGGGHWIGPSVVSTAVAPGIFDPLQGEVAMDGLAGARADLAVAPSVDIANGRPGGSGASEEIFVAWSDATAGLNHEQLMLTWSRNGGQICATPRAVALQPGDRPMYVAPAVSPDGTDVYIVYNAYTTPYRNDTTSPRELLGVVLHADVSNGVPGAFGVLNRGPVGDPRGSSANALTDEFLGDYVYAAASNDGATAVWNDASNAADCPAIDAYRASLYTSTPLAAPAVLTSCPTKFGNSDIRGGNYPDPS